MAIVSISEAARLTGKSRTTIQKYIKQGKLSKCSGTDGTFGIDTSELLRVFGSLSEQGTTCAQIVHSMHQFAGKNAHNGHAYSVHDHTEHLLLEQENESLKKEIELLQQLIAEKDKRNEDLKHSLFLLEDKTEKSLQKNTEKKPWWKLFS